MISPGTTAEALERLDAQGFVVLERLLTRPGHRVRLATNGREALTLAAEKGVDLLLLTALVNETPRAYPVSQAIVEPNYLLTACQVIHLLPGETEQAVHFDDGFYSIPRPRPSVSISTIWAVDDFTAENGATEVIPGSHRWDDAQLPDQDDPRLRPVVMPAGSAVIFHGTLWHRGGANRSDAPRCAISPQYCQPWARQQENMMLAVGARAARYSERIRAMLGYSIHPPFMGFVDGGHPSRLIEDGYDADRTGASVESKRFWERGGHLTPRD